MGVREWLFRRLAVHPARSTLAAENEASFTVGALLWGESERDRAPWDRDGSFQQALDAWRSNPLARRIIEITSQYAAGGVTVGCDHPQTRLFLNELWNHPLNRLSARLLEWSDELARSGNLFVILSTDPGGMSYLRALPSAQVREIRARENDLEQGLELILRPAGGSLEERRIPLYDPLLPCEYGPDFPVVGLHYAINRPVGAQWGESDLTPILRWLQRYSAWLEDRARLNRYRTSFLYVVRGRYTSDAERYQRQAQLNAAPPAPGSILVTDEGEQWEIISSKLEASEAAADGLALKKMIAAGAGLPLHFLAEPESATRSTAEAAGGPTFRRLQQRQEFILWMVEDVLRAALRRRSRVDRAVRTDARICLSGADISARDNAELAAAAEGAARTAVILRDRGLIDDAEMLRLVYRFGGESADLPELLRQARKNPQGPGKEEE